MSRRDQYKQNLGDFKSYADQSVLPAAAKNTMLDEVNRENEIMMLCDLTDAICEIAKTMDGIKAEICQIRRQMPR